MKVDEHSEEQPTDQTSTTAARSGVYPVTTATSGVYPPSTHTGIIGFMPLTRAELSSHMNGTVVQTESSSQPSQVTSSAPTDAPPPSYESVVCDQQAVPLRR